MRIGILKADETPDALLSRHGEYDSFYVKLLSGKGFEFSVYPVFNDVFPASIDAAGGWLVTGSRYSAWDDVPWIKRLKGLIVDLDFARKPLVGVCFGHQVIASALGGVVERSPEGWNVGPVTYSRLDSGASQSVLAWHQDKVTELPPAARVVGRSGACDNALLRYGDHIFTMQCHPELSPEFVRDLLAHHDGELPGDMLERTKLASAAALDADGVAAEIAEFFRLRAN